MPRRVRARADFVAAAACALFGILVVILPHGMEWRRLGAPIYFGDPDITTAYLQVISQAYNFHSWRLGDPAAAVTGSGTSFYPGAIFVPFILVAKSLQMGPVGVLLLWRIWSGLGWGLSIYAILRTVCARPAFAGFGACMLIADTGLVTGRLFDQQAVQVFHALKGSGNSAEAWTEIHNHLRVLNPGVTWPFLGFFLWMILRLNEKQNTPRLLLASVAFGLLFHVYFYFWTAASAALLLAFCIQPSMRRIYIQVAIIGGLFGLPALLLQVAARSHVDPNWLERCVYFVRTPRFESLQIPKLTILWLVASLWLLRRSLNGKIQFMAFFIVAAILVNNQHVITGIEIQRYHWKYAWGPATGILAAMAILNVLQRRCSSALAAFAVGVLAFIHIGAGVYLRIWETQTAEVPRHIQERFADYLGEQKAAPAPTLLAASVIAGDPTYVGFAVAMEAQIPLVGANGLSFTVTQREWRERRTLNAWLASIPRSEAFDAIYAYYGCWNELLRMTPDEKAAEKRRVEELYDQVAANPEPWLRKYNVVYVAETAGISPPAAALLEPFHQGRHWSIWKTK